jgi:hypothetical protein
LLPNGSISDIIKKSLVLLNIPEGAVLTERKLILNKVVKIFSTGGEEVRSVCSDILC